MEELLLLADLPDADQVWDEILEFRWKNMQVDANEDIQHEQIFSKITSDSRFSKSAKTKKIVFKTFRKSWAYAAMLLLASGIGLAIYVAQHEVSHIQVNKILAKAILPGSKKAILTLNDGSEVSLEETPIGNIELKGNIELNHQVGKLSYVQINENDTPAQHMIATPKGGEYQLILQDGTKVWLNAATKISYPVSFSGRERRVKVLGEAYFEVAKNAMMPFIVEANGTEVSVLGTHFNVSAYADDKWIETTLIEGSVRVSRQGQTAMLRPGQESRINSSATGIYVTNVDTEQALAWKNGYFMFKNEDIREVMKKIGRWYDLDIEYKGDLTGKTFGGTISRFADIADLLKSIELTKDVHFSRSGRRVTVMP